jgi:predicted nucleic acid-binding protein
VGRPHAQINAPRYSFEIVEGFASLSTFVDTSVWFAAINRRDTHNEIAKSILSSISNPILTDHVLVETWRLVNSKLDRRAADRFWSAIRNGAAALEKVSLADLETAWAIGTAFPDQSFSIVDCTSLAVMERLRITQVATFDHHFAVYRYGPSRDKAFEVTRSGHSAAFRMFQGAILEQQQITCTYDGRYREICPHILGHSDGEEKALVFQFGGETRSKLPRGGEWRCFRLADVKDIKIRVGAWHSGTRHRSAQRCVNSVYLDVNTEVANQPGRRNDD